jgi:hypothetical protein
MSRWRKCVPVQFYFYSLVLRFSYSVVVKFSVLMNRIITLAISVLIANLTFAQSVLYDPTLDQGSGFNGPVNAIAVQSDGKIIVGGSFTDYKGTTVANIVRLSPQGALDNSFNVGVAVNGPVYALHVTSNDDVIAGGDFTAFGYKNILKVKSNGSVDFSFSNNGGFSGPVYAIVSDQNGKIYVGGDFTTYNSLGANRIVKMGVDGIAETPFLAQIGAGFSGGAVKSLIVTTSGVLLAGGNFTSFNDLPSAQRLVRLSLLGTLDPSFLTNLGTINGEVRAMASDNSGDIVIAGAFTQVGANSWSRIGKIKDTGNPVSATFNGVTTGFNNDVNALDVTTNGDIYATGNFTSYNGNQANGVARLKSNGAFDTDYLVQIGLQGGTLTGRAAAVQTDGRLLVGGSFTNYNGTVVGNFARLLRYAITPVVSFVQTEDWCQGYEFTFTYGKEGDYDILNYFEAQLSDANGSFSNPTVIGQDFSPSAIMFASIPQDALAGNGYRIRVVSTAPAIVGNNLGLGGFVINPVVITPTVIGVSCNGGSDGSITLAASGGGAQPIEYDWLDLGIISPSISNLSEGSYEMSWKTADDNCGSETSYYVPEPSVLTAFATSDDVSCFGASDGNVQLNVSGGTPTYSFLWSNGSSLPGLSSVVSDDYSVTVTDANGCTVAAAAAVSSPTEVQVNIVPTHVQCNGGNNGSATVSVSGGAGGYGFLWSPGGQTTQTITGLQAGSYGLTVTDADGCVGASSVLITQPSPFVPTISAGGPTTFCQGGSVVLTASSGIAYLWNGGATTSSVSVNQSGSYSVNVTDANGCVGNAVPVDVTVLPNITENISQTICDGSAFEGYTATGIYTDVFTAANGCDSTRVLDLMVLPNITENIAQTICDGSAFEGYTATGVYTDVFTAANGCDSTRVLDLTVLPNITENISQTICDGSAFEGYTSTGIYTDVFTAANGCDSTRVLDLTVLPNITENISQTICDGSVFEGYTSTGIYTDVFTAANGCDSTRVLDLTVLPNITENISQTICDGSAFEGYTSTGIYTDVFTAANGCDSTRVLDLTVLPNITENISQTICDGSVFEGYTSTGIYTDVFIAANGCDSTRVLDLTVLPNITENIDQTICDGSAFEGYTVTGIYTDVFTAANGCDSTRVLELTVLPNITENISQTICDGSAFEGYTATGIYTDVFTAANGCDSTRVLDLTVLPNITENISQTICDGSVFDGYTATGIYTDVFTAANGCDSTRVLNLTVLPGLTVDVDIENANCNGLADGQLTVNASNGLEPYSYDIGAGPQAESIFAGLSAGPYTVTVADANGCSSEANVTLSNSSSNLVPQIFILSDQGNTVCEGVSVPFTAFAVNGGTAANYDWLVNGISVGTGSTVNFSVNGLQNGDEVSCVLTSSDQCASPTTATSTAVVMTVVGPPQTPVAITGESVVCQGSVTAYSVDAVAGATAYSWTAPSGWSVAGSSTTVQVTAGLGSGNISVTAINGCGSSASTSLPVASTPNFLSLSGTVLINGAPVMAGWVYTYTEILDGVGYQKADSTEISAGAYAFEELPIYSVSFILEAVADRTLYPEAIPSFYAVFSGGIATCFHQWDSPDYQCSISASCGDVLVKNFSVLSEGELNGSCSLNGTVSWATNKMQAEDPIPGVDVVVEKIPPGNAYTSGLTDGLGRFRFEELPVSNGTFYRLYVSIPGIPMADTYVVTIDPNDTALINLDFYVDTINNVITTLNPAGITQSMEPLGELTLLPNPMQETTTVLLPSRFGEAVAYRITAVDGRVMAEKRLQVSNRFSVAREGLSSGVYMIEVVNAEGLRAMTRMVVQ